MAIRIISSTERCSSCYTTVEFEATDVIVTDYYEDDVHIREDYIICPHCGDRIILDRY